MTYKFDVIVNLNYFNPVKELLDKVNNDMESIFGVDDKVIATSVLYSISMRGVIEPLTYGQIRTFEVELLNTMKKVEDEVSKYIVDVKFDKIEENC